MALKFSMLIEARNRASAPVKQAQASVTGLAGAVRRWGREVRKTANEISSGERSLEHFERRARRLRQVALGTFFRAAGEQARRFNSEIRTGIRNLDLLGRTGRGLKAGGKWLGGKAMDLVGGAAKWGAAGIGALTSYSIFDVFKTGGQFEQYQIMLEGMEGSAGKARKAMRWVQKFAKDTPYELDQVMEAFVALKSYGIDPMNGSLQSLGDGASGMSKDLGQSVEALADAITGEYERLKEFGIRASKAGDKVTFTYRKNGKDIQRTVKATGTEIENAITGIFSDRFGGGMTRQSKSMFGILSNIKDAWSGFMLMVADAGVFDRVKRKLAEWQDRLNAMSQDGRLEAWAKGFSDNLERAFDWGVKFAEETDWAAVGRGLGTAVETMAQLVALFGQAVSKYEQWQANRAATQAESLEKGWFTSEKTKAEARNRRRAIESKYGVQTETGQQEAESASNNRLKNDIDRIRWRRSQVGSTGWKRLPQSGGGKPASAAPVKVGGALDITVKVQGNGTATVQRMASSNPAVPLRAKTGKVMGGAA